MTLKIAAKYAQYTNFDGTLEGFTRKSELLAGHCRDVGTDFDAIVRSANYNVAIGATEAEVEDRLQQLKARMTPLVAAEARGGQLGGYRGLPACGTPSRSWRTCASSRPRDDLRDLLLPGGRLRPVGHRAVRARGHPGAGVGRRPCRVPLMSSRPSCTTSRWSGAAPPNTLRSYTADLERYVAHLRRRASTTSLPSRGPRHRFRRRAAHARGRPARARRVVGGPGARGGPRAAPLRRPRRPGARRRGLRRHPAALPRRLPRTLSIDEVDQLLAGCPGDDPAALRDRALLELLYSTGARISEAVGIDLDDLDARARTVLLRGKGGKQRLVPVGRPALAVEAYRCGPSGARRPVAAAPRSAAQRARRAAVAAERLPRAARGRRDRRA